MRGVTKPTTRPPKGARGARGHGIVSTKLGNLRQQISTTLGKDCATLTKVHLKINELESTIDREIFAVLILHIFDFCHSGAQTKILRNC